MGHQTQTEPPELQLYREVIAELQQRGRTTRRSDLEAALSGPSDEAYTANLANLLTHCAFAEGDYPAALSACQTWLDRAPSDRLAKDTLLSILSRLNRSQEIIELATVRLASEPDNDRLHSALAKAFGSLGRIEEARAAGNECLRLKDASAAGPVHDLANVEVKPVDATNPDRNIIAFSLYGSNAAYYDGAVRNVLAAAFLYPEWRCRFYVDDSVPRRVIDRLLTEGAKVRRVGGLPAGRFGTFWRFLVADDEAIDRYLVRDCDACLSMRERSAVDAWFASGRHFHVMRDGMTHTEPMLAGMWGGVCAALPSIQQQIMV